MQLYAISNLKNVITPARNNIFKLRQKFLEAYIPFYQKQQKFIFDIQSSDHAPYYCIQMETT